MKIITIKISKEKCKDICPLPLNLIPNVEKGINKINYNEKTKIVKIGYNERLLSKHQIISKLKKIGYGVRK